MSVWTAFWVGIMVGAVVMFMVTIAVFRRVLNEHRRAQHSDGYGSDDAQV